MICRALQDIFSFFCLSFREDHRGKDPGFVYHIVNKKTFKINYKSEGCISFKCLRKKIKCKCIKTSSRKNYIWNHPQSITYAHAHLESEIMFIIKKYHRKDQTSHRKS